MTAAAPDRRVERIDASAAEHVLPLLEAAFGRWPAIEIDVPPIDHLRWKMTGPPGAPPHTHSLIVQDGEPVAAQVRWLAWAHVGAEVLPFDRGTDLAVSPDHQGQGLARFMFDDDPARNTPLGDFVRWDTPSNDARVLHLEPDTVVWRELRSWVRTFDVRGFLATHREQGLRHLARATIKAARPASRRPTDPAASPIAELTEFGPETDALWERASPQFDVARVRDANLMNWRYLDPRAGNATVLAATARGTTAGYVAFKRAGPEGLILDLVVDPDPPDLAAALLRAASDRLRVLGCRAVRCWLPPGHVSEPALGAAGFYDTGQPQPLMIDITWMPDATEALAIIRDPASRLHVAIGDFDYV